MCSKNVRCVFYVTTADWNNESECIQYAVNSAAVGPIWSLFYALAASDFRPSAVVAEDQSTVSIDREFSTLLTFKIQ